MNKIKISSLWCGDISQSVIINLIKKFSKKKIEFVHPKDCDILFFGPYDLASTKRRVFNKFKKKIGKLANYFPNIDFYSLNRKIKPLRIFYSQENVNINDIYYDYSITSRFNIYDQTHLRFPLWKELIDWSHLDIKRDLNPFILRFDNFFSIKELISPQGDTFLKKEKKICIFSSHINEPRKSIINFFSKNFKVDGYGQYFDKNIKHHNLGSYSKKDILKNYAFNLCPENSLYPGYYTEKVPEAFLSKTLPITWADPNIKYDFNEKSIINLLDYSKDNYQEIIHLLEDDKFLQKFSHEPLLLQEPNLDNEIKFVEKILNNL
jgi:hypothetical protein